MGGVRCLRENPASPVYHIQSTPRPAVVSALLHKTRRVETPMEQERPFRLHRTRPTTTCMLLPGAHRRHPQRGRHVLAADPSHPASPRAAVLQRDGHRDRGADGDRHGPRTAASGVLHRNLSIEEQASYGRPGQAQRVGHDHRTRSPRRPTPPIAEVDALCGAVPHLRCPGRRRRRPRSWAS